MGQFRGWKSFLREALLKERWVGPHKNLYHWSKGILYFYSRQYRFGVRGVGLWSKKESLIHRWCCIYPYSANWKPVVTSSTPYLMGKIHRQYLLCMWTVLTTLWFLDQQIKSSSQFDKETSRTSLHRKASCAWAVTARLQLLKDFQCHTFHLFKSHECWKVEDPVKLVSGQ